MKLWLFRLGKIATWLVTCLLFLYTITFAINNRFAISAPWMHGDANYCGPGCEATVGYNNIGFPVSYFTGSTSGVTWPVFVINILFALICFAVLAWLLSKKPKIGFACCILLSVVFITNYFNIFH